MAVIVALPSLDDSVLLMSSESAPHLTILYLGDDMKNLDHVQEFIAHAATTSLPAFSMDVERRGELGDKAADVLFFGKYGRQKVEDLRSYLLTNSDISKAYHSVEQYPTWTPHLTLGYPEKPAKQGPDQRFPMIVTFDRLALWPTDKEDEGVEFPLKQNNLLMNDGSPSDYLEHYGIKGMKWGVIREHINAGAKYAKSSDDHKRVGEVRKKAKIAGVNSLTNKDLQEIITRMNLEVQYKSLKTVQHEQSLIGKGKLWAGRFLTRVGGDIITNVATSWLKRPGSKGHSKPSHARSWVGQQPTIQGSYTQKSLGS